MYWIIAWGHQYRVTSERFATRGEAAKNLYGMWSNSMKAESFSRSWKYLSNKKKDELEKAVGMPGR